MRQGQDPGDLARSKQSAASGLTGASRGTGEQQQPPEANYEILPGI